MKKVASGFESELHVSSKWICAALVLVGLCLVLLSDALPEPSVWVPVVLLSMLLLAAAAIIWVLDNHSPLAGRWLTLLTLTLLVYLGERWLDIPGLLALLVIPTALAAALISLPAAVATSAGQTVALLLTMHYAGQDPATVISPLIAIWATVAITYAIYLPVKQVSQWSWQHFQQAQHLLKEARERQVKLKQALEDLAHANTQLTRLNIVAQGLRQAAEDARIAKEQFVANVSHELRTPLNMIVGFSEMIVEAPETYGDAIPPVLQADLNVIRRNAEHLSALIDDVLDLSQIEAQQMALTKEYVPFREIIDTATTVVSPLFESKGLYLKSQVPDKLPTVFCDRTRIREVLVNLLSNAGRFTERGGVRIQAQRQESALIVSVADTGPGITANNMGKLFQPFQQIDGSIRRRYGGTGLGLSISKHFIELHGGKIWVESQVGTGTIFYFELPITPIAQASRSFTHGMLPEWEYLQHTRPITAPRPTICPRFVVLESGDVLQRLLARYLTQVEIVAANTPEKALQELRDSPSQALLINDVSATETHQELASAALPYGVPVITCSVPGTQERAGALGASDYMVKPISRDRLLNALDHLELRGKTILLIDDEPEALRLFRRMLASSTKGYRVLRARDGKEAANILREDPPDAILLDLVMPNMDGFQLLEAREHDPKLKNIPVIVISACDPAGQPIISNAMSVTQRDGLSIPQLLACIKAISEILSSTSQPGDLTPIATPAG